MPETGTANQTSKRSLALLSLGAAAGIALAIAAVLAPPEPLNPGIAAEIVATVNGRPLRRAALERAAAGLSADLDRAITKAEKARILDRLIEEELLDGPRCERDHIDSEAARGDSELEADTRESFAEYFTKSNESRQTQEPIALEDNLSPSPRGDSR